MSAVFEKAYLAAREAFHRNVPKNVNFRVRQLKQLAKCVQENEELWLEALKADLNKHRNESMITEISVVLNEIQYQLDHIHEFVKPHYVKKGLANLFQSCFVKYEPFGVVLIFSAWNYPFSLMLAPLVGAIAAGNCAIIKPSELAANCEKLFAELIPKYLDKDCFHVVTGGPDVSTIVLKERFDLIFFTGSPMVGKIIYAAAAKNLTPVVLELGGKNPLYLDNNISKFDLAVKRILWAKFMNAGQTCIAPDYIICSAETREKFVKAAGKHLKDFYGYDPKKSDSYGRIINQRNYDRLMALIKSTKGNIEIGGDGDRDQCFIAPTIITGVDQTDPVMEGEIFGPILPIIEMMPDEAIEFIKRGEKPLSMYVFSENNRIVDKFIEETSAGSMAINDCLMQVLLEELPFGGVGTSGMGKYHGRYSFEAFSHTKSILKRGYNVIEEAIVSNRNPPYTESKIKNLAFFSQKTFINDLDFDQLFRYTIVLIVGMAIFGLIQSIISK